MKWILALLLMSAAAFAEDYQCGNDAGCPARITEDGVLNEVMFRKGDMVSTDAGWSVSTDDGWVKVKTSPRRKLHSFGNRCALRVAYLAGFHTVVTNVPTYAPPTAFGSFAAAVPVSFSLIGL